METGQTENTHEIPKPVAQQIARMLGETESVIWSGKPRSKDYFHCKILEFAGGWLLLIMLFVIISCIIIWEGVDNSEPYVWKIVFIATMLVAAVIIQTVWIFMKGASITYALTDNRVIILRRCLNDAIVFRSHVFSQKSRIEATSGPLGNWTIKLIHKHHFLVRENKPRQHKPNQMKLLSIENIELFQARIPNMLIKDTTHEC